MNLITLKVWLLAAMIVFSPPGRATFLSVAQESKDSALARYEQIAEVIAQVALDPEEEPIVSRRYTAALLLSLTFHESAGWRRDVDLDIDRVRMGRHGWQDHGRSWCLGQHNLGLRCGPDGKCDSVEKTAEGWSGRDLVEDREKCIRATLHAARKSFGTTQGMPFGERLTVYASGNNESADGKRKSVRRIVFANRVFGRTFPTPAPSFETVLSSN